MSMTSYDLIAILPLIILVLWVVLLILVDLVLPKEQQWITPLLAALGLLVSMGFALAQIGRQYVAFGGMVVVDGFAIFLSVLFLGSGLVAVALAYDYLQRVDIGGSEYYILLMFSISGMMLMAIAADLIVVFLALELLSIPLYVLSGFNPRSRDSEEAALKYFLLGAFAGGFVVYGIALVFGATGTTGLAGIVEAVASGAANLSLLAVGGGLILVGLGFKVAAVPFHMWTPDVYQGAPTSATAFMSVGAKAAGFAALLRVLVVAFPAVAIDLGPDPVGDVCADDDRGKCRCDRPARYQAYAGILKHRSCRLHHDGGRTVCAGGRRTRRRCIGAVLLAGVCLHQLRCLGGGDHAGAC